MTRHRYDIATEGLEDEPLGPSKTRMKQEMHDLQDLGLALLDLPHERFARIHMDEHLRAAFDELGRITSHGARRVACTKVLPGNRRGRSHQADGRPRDQ